MEGFRVSAVHSGQAATVRLQKPHAFDALVFDIMMPNISDLDVLQSVRSKSRIPIVMLTGRGDEID